ncbi:MAG: ABC transporter permease subunit [Gammaproteobacteria bacterium]|nr:MAG: ABC transporter permease subunit [Gammaproteobacteria bacterium]
MVRYLLIRTGLTLLTFWLIVTVVFFLMRLAPGGPFDGERRLPPEVETNLRAAYNLDKSLPQQYIDYLGMLVRGDLGPSFRQKDFSVNELVAIGLPVSLTIGGLALIIATTVGIAVGLRAGLSPGSRKDIALMGLTNIGIALPTIIVAPLLVLVFGVTLGWLPTGGVGSFSHYILPPIALALPFTAAIARLTRGSVVETLSQPHLKTARAKGLTERLIIRRHIFPIALLPVVSYLGPAATSLLTGSVVIEQVFELPGIGRYFVQGALNRDYTLVMGVVVVYAALILMFNLLVDLAYAWMDPRIRLQE